VTRDFEREEAAPQSIGLGRGGSDERPRVHPVVSSEAEHGDNRRERIRYRDREFRVRPSEFKILRTLGVFRVIREEDLIQGIHGRQNEVGRADLHGLKVQKLVQGITLQPLGDAPIRVFTLTKTGYEILKSRDGNVQLYWGIVKPSEVEHDSLLYRAFLREKENIERSGGTVLRVALDGELKQAHYKRIGGAGDSYRLAQAESAKELGLPIVQGKVVFPDVRVEYQDERGDLGRVDIEVATGNYRERQIELKIAAGFQVYSTSLGIHSGHPLRGNINWREHREVMSL
jgi:hypothetical protein